MKSRTPNALVQVLSSKAAGKKQPAALANVNKAMAIAQANNVNVHASLQALATEFISSFPASSAP